jgi:hypothetical protein
VPWLEVNLNWTIAPIVVFAAYMSLTASCTGGCWLKADPVSTAPETDCLALFGGLSASNSTVCEVPRLGGVNNCTDELTLPTRSAGEPPVVVVPGEAVDWPLPSSHSVPPGISVTNGPGGRTDYSIIAMLGKQSITITIPVW